MYTESKGAPSLLLIEDDPGLRSLFAALLTEAGYTYTFAWSLEEARYLADEHTFALVMADLFLDGTMQHLRDFCALIHPIPLALMTRLPLAQTIDLPAIAFILSMPFDIEEYLGQIAAAINVPLDAEQQRQVEQARQYLAALEVLDWDSLLQLCTEDVIFIPPARSRIISSPWIQGGAAFRASTEAIKQHYPQVHYLDLVFAATPNGLAVRYINQWQTPEGPKELASTTLLYFQGDLIRQVGQRTESATFPRGAISAPNLRPLRAKALEVPRFASTFPAALLSRRALV